MYVEKSESEEISLRLTVEYVEEFGEITCFLVYCVRLVCDTGLRLCCLSLCLTPLSFLMANENVFGEIGLVIGSGVQL